MPIELDERGRALENEYFRQRERELLEKMKTKVSAATAATADGLNCPKCDGKLVETNFENIKIDVCDKCTGVWLDAGELAQITTQDTENAGFFGRIFS